MLILFHWWGVNKRNNLFRQSWLINLFGPPEKAENTRQANHASGYYLNERMLHCLDAFLQRMAGNVGYDADVEHLGGSEAWVNAFSSQCLCLRHTLALTEILTNWIIVIGLPLAFLHSDAFFHPDRFKSEQAAVVLSNGYLLKVIAGHLCAGFLKDFHKHVLTVCSWCDAPIFVSPPSIHRSRYGGDKRCRVVNYLSRFPTSEELGRQWSIKGNRSYMFTILCNGIICSQCSKDTSRLLKHSETHVRVKLPGKAKSFEGKFKLNNMINHKPFVSYWHLPLHGDGSIISRLNKGGAGLFPERTIAYGKDVRLNMEQVSLYIRKNTRRFSVHTRQRSLAVRHIFDNYYGFFYDSDWLSDFEGEELSEEDEEPRAKRPKSQE